MAPDQRTVNRQDMKRRAELRPETPNKQTAFLYGTELLESVNTDAEGTSDQNHCHVRRLSHIICRRVLILRSPK